MKHPLQGIVNTVLTEPDFVVAPSPPSGLVVLLTSTADSMRPVFSFNRQGFEPSVARRYSVAAAARQLVEDAMIAAQEAQGIEMPVEVLGEQVRQRELVAPLKHGPPELLNDLALAGARRHQVEVFLPARERQCHVGKPQHP